MSGKGLDGEVFVFIVGRDAPDRPEISRGRAHDGGATALHMHGRPWARADRDLIARQ